MAPSGIARVPVLGGEPWHITGYPELGDLAFGQNHFQDPLDFGLGEDSKLITTLHLAAPKIVQVDGQDYVSTVEDLKGEIPLLKLNWV